tara:strand:+ start:186 stop:1769 length:1584 start_codon:yes stop_codon:yes gene_type:complete
MTLKKRFIIGFALIIGLLLGSSLYSAFKINAMHETTEKLYNHPYTVNNAIAEIRFTLGDCDKIVSDLAYGQITDLELAKKEVEKHSVVIGENLKIIKTQFLGDQSYYNDFLDKSKELEKSYLAIFAFASESNLDAGIQEYKENTKIHYLENQRILDKFLSFAKEKGNEFLLNSTEDKESTLNSFIIISIIIILLASAFAYKTLLSFTKPINYAKATAEEIATGNLSVNFEFSKKDEIGSLLESIQIIVNNIKRASDFTEKIGAGEINAEFEPVGEQDTLGQSLLEMRSKLQTVAEEDEKRNWSTRGLAIFGEILRSDSNDLNLFGQQIITKLIEYLNANQGGVFIINDVDPEDPKMEMIAAYAYDREKYLSKEIRKGQGLIGQSWEENNKIYLKQIPQNYISIKSGLGDANPSSLLIIPLKENDDIFGMIELASFKEFEEYEIEFLERLAQSIGATFKNLKTNIQTTKLLAESQNMQETMQEQEETMRQNIEEMQATQDMMDQKETEYQDEIKDLKKEVRGLKENNE